MRNDFNNWMPLSVAEIYSLFSKVGIQWGIAGGWALDLHLRKQTREHSDIDVVITREEHLTAYDYLNQDWMLYKAEKGKLSLWEDREFLYTTMDIWVSKSSDTPFVFQMMLVDTEGDSWVYGRNKSIKRPFDDLFLKSDEGIPYIRPEIQLLYKAGSSQVRDKDYRDFRTILPSLLPQEKEWLKTSLSLQFPEGHDWIKFL